MKKIQIHFGFSKDVVIKGDRWYMLALDQHGLQCYGSILRSGVDYDNKRGKLKVIGVDVDGY